jgi:hypothetical protein
VSSDKQKQQLHHQQLTNGSTILKTLTFPEFWDLFKLIYSIYWFKFGKNILAMHIPKMLPTVELRGGARAFEVEGILKHLLPLVTSNKSYS